MYCQSRHQAVGNWWFTIPRLLHLGNVTTWKESAGPTERVRACRVSLDSQLRAWLGMLNRNSISKMCGKLQETWRYCPTPGQPPTYCYPRMYSLALYDSPAILPAVLFMTERRGKRFKRGTVLSNWPSAKYQLLSFCVLAPISWRTDSANLGAAPCHVCFIFWKMVLNSTPFFLVRTFALLSVLCLVMWVARFGDLRNQHRPVVPSYNTRNLTARVLNVRHTLYRAKATSSCQLCSCIYIEEAFRAQTEAKWCRPETKQHMPIQITLFS